MGGCGPCQANEEMLRGLPEKRFFKF